MRPLKANGRLDPLFDPLFRLKIPIVVVGQRLVDERRLVIRRIVCRGRNRLRESRGKGKGQA